MNYFFGSPLIYSEPALSSLNNVIGFINLNQVACSYSEAALPNVRLKFFDLIWN